MYSHLAVVIIRFGILFDRLILINKRILFSCSFDNINNYPFGSQSCHWQFFLPGGDNKLTEIVPRHLEDLGPAGLGQYIVESWAMRGTHQQSTDMNKIEVTMVLRRRILREWFNLKVYKYKALKSHTFMGSRAHRLRLQHSHLAFSW